MGFQVSNHHLRILLYFAAYLAVLFLPLNASCMELGWIKLILQDPSQFNTPEDGCESELCRSLVDLIDGADSSLDFAIYGARNQTEILNAILRASKRGVFVRGYVDKDSNNENYYSSTEEWIRKIGTIRDDFIRESICAKPFRAQSRDMCRRPDGFKGPLQCIAYDIGDEYLVAAHASREPITSKNMIMHNKFFVIDGLHVWTGSANISDSGTGGYNANAVVLIKSSRIATVYTEEFENLWNRGNSCKKEANGIENFQIGDSKITTWFSPQDRTARYGLKSLISKANRNINIAVFFLTSKYLTADLIAAHRRGVNVRVIIDATAAKNGYSKHELLREVGIPVKVENWGGKMHMKSASIDRKFLVMGSMNWTSAGEYSNDENTLLINSDRLASKFDDYYEMIWSSIHEKWLGKNVRPNPESRDSGTACIDGVDNDFDDHADSEDAGCSENPPALPLLPPHDFISKDDHRKEQYRIINSGRCDPSYPDWFVCLPSKMRNMNMICSRIPYRNFTVTRNDPLRLDKNQTGIGCVD